MKPVGHSPRRHDVETQQTVHGDPKSTLVPPELTHIDIDDRVTLQLVGGLLLCLFRIDVAEDRPSTRVWGVDVDQVFRIYNIQRRARVVTVSNSPRIVDVSRVLICPEAPTRAAAIVIASLSSISDDSSENCRSSSRETT